ncbi:MAG: hypothetical protein RL021_1785, partial [Bacteroidota bacterium]
TYDASWNVYGARVHSRRHERILTESVEILHDDTVRRRIGGGNLHYKADRTADGTIRLAIPITKEIAAVDRRIHFVRFAGIQDRSQ